MDGMVLVLGWICKTNEENGTSGSGLSVGSTVCYMHGDGEWWYNRPGRNHFNQRRFEPRISSKLGELLRFRLEIRSSGSPLGVLRPIPSLPPP